MMSAQERGIATTPESHPPVAPRLRPTFLALVFVYLVLFTWATRHYLMDDAYIGLRVADNLLRGRGPVFNPGERVEAVTNLGWVLVIALGGAIGPLFVVAKLLGLAGLMLSILLLTRQRCVAAAPPILFCLACFPLMYFSVGGMETGLLAAMVGLLATAGECESAACPLLGACAFLVHPEAGAIFPAAAAILFIAGLRSRRATFRDLAIFATVVGAFTVARMGYYGFPLPNTFRAKPSEFQQILQRATELLTGSLTNVPFPFSGPLGLLLLVWGARCLWSTHPVLAAYTATTAAVGLGFCVYARPDWTVLARYGAPYVPAMALVSWAAISDGIRRLPGIGAAGRIAVSGIVIIAVVVAGGLDISRNLAPDAVETYPGYVVFGHTLEAPSRWIGEHVAASATVATRRIGAIAYFSDRRILDYRFGLSDRRVTDLFRSGRDIFDTPSDPALEQIWLTDKPDYLLEDLDCMSEISRPSPAGLHRFVIHGLTYRVQVMFTVGRNGRWVLCRRDPLQSRFH
jgi:arabinofuranosyltransferase